ncbi:hypothetical protein QP157_09520 [Sphingomonas sp. LR61]|uniref:hypothetical protein n=1 Tax=Sphingomonas sp. LR61 TaxID=3050234 RepID=UPI002FE2D948
MVGADLVDVNDAEHVPNRYVEHAGPLTREVADLVLFVGPDTQELCHVLRRAPLAMDVQLHLDVLDHSGSVPLGLRRDRGGLSAWMRRTSTSRGVR